jgi:hypothetical protein
VISHISSILSAAISVKEMFNQMPTFNEEALSAELFSKEDGAREETTVWNRRI